MTARKTTLEHLLALTRGMLDSAADGDWDALIEQEKARQPVYRKVLAEGIARQPDMAREILALDERIRRLVEDGMPRIRQELVRLRQAGRASDAYRCIENSRGEP